jgi:hypothetical protein
LSPTPMVLITWLYTTINQAVYMCLPFYVNQKKSENLSLLVTNVFYCIYMYAEVFVILVSFVLNICSHAADKAHRAGITVLYTCSTFRIPLFTFSHQER